METGKRTTVEECFWCLVSIPAGATVWIPDEHDLETVCCCEDHARLVAETYPLPQEGA